MPLWATFIILIATLAILLSLPFGRGARDRSAEPAAALSLASLGLDPIFDLVLRLGEGTGAVLGLHLVTTAVATQLSMATFATAGIVAQVSSPASQSASFACVAGWPK